MTDELQSHPLARFFARCEEEGDCLVWGGGVTSAGAPIARVDGQNAMLRRLVFLAKGQPLKPGYKITTNCECRRCLAPAHVVQMTQGEIVKRSHKKRGMDSRVRVSLAKRAASPMSGRHLEAISRVAAGETKKSVARDMGVSASAISALTLGKTWRPLGGLW